MSKIYIGILDSCSFQKENWETEEIILKIGSTEQTCWARCRKENYQIFAARDCFDITLAETLFIESYVRMAFNEMLEVENRLKTDYFVLNKKSLEELNFYKPPKSFRAFNIEKNNYLKMCDWAVNWLFQFIDEAIKIINYKRTYSHVSPIDFRDYCGFVSPYTY